MAWQPGTYVFERQRDAPDTVQVHSAFAKTLPAPSTLSFPSGWDAPAELELADFMSWTQLPDTFAQVFSGTARYRNSFTVEPNELVVLWVGEEVRLPTD